jgi:hypothetical protein
MSDDQPERPARIQVTATDLDTNESSTVVISDDYVIVCAGTCYREYVEDRFDGTHVITVKGRRQGLRDAGDAPGGPS